ncbi:MAG: DsrH/TusB family sulfur metabolism protein [Candidatus Rokuibacteriota bacterium]
MASILMVLISSPASPAGQRALAMVESLVDQGHVLTLCCLQDAVLLAGDHLPREAGTRLDRLLERGARLLVLGEDLACRGLTPGDRVPTIDHAGIVALLAAAHDRVIGAL